jgi:hypothetical protein
MNDAIKGAPVRTRRRGTTVLDPEASYVTIINAYVVEPERADELIAFLVEATDRRFAGAET